MQINDTILLFYCVSCHIGLSFMRDAIVPGVGSTTRDFDGVTCTYVTESLFGDFICNADFVRYVCIQSLPLA